MKRAAVFFDRDNTLVVNDGYLGDPNGVVLVEGAAAAVARARAMGFAVVVFSNQSGVARGMFAEEAVHAVNHRLDEMLHDEDAGAVIDRHEFCPFHPQASVDRYRQDSDLRKPKPGMIYQAERQLALDLGRSWVVGDAPRDIDAGRAAGCRTILVTNTALPASPASWEAGAGKPDFEVRSLAEAMDVIERNASRPSGEAPPAAPDGDVAGLTRDAGGSLKIEPAAPVAATAIRVPVEPAPGADVASPEAPHARGVRSHETPPRAARSEGAETPARESQGPTRDAESPARSAPSTGASGSTLRPKPRSEVLLEQILDELRRRHEQHPDADFSVSKMMAGVVQILALAAMFIAYIRRDQADAAFLTILVAIFLQVFTVALLIMGRQR
jgi:D-glycero-D-manno-heptose 1,7-bisphosphate phosphatase